MNDIQMYVITTHFIPMSPTIQIKRCRCRDRIVFGYTTTYAISVYYH